MFRTPVAALHHADGSVRCGECSLIFVGLKHALLFDTPIVERLEAHTVHIEKKRSWTWLIFVTMLLLVLIVGAGISHMGLTKNAFSLQYVQAVNPIYKTLGLQAPTYVGIEPFVLGQSLLSKDEDQSIRLSFTLYNHASVPVQWPRLKVTLLGASGETTYEVVTNIQDLLSVKPTGPVAPLSNTTLEAHIAADKALNAVTYKLEVVHN